MEGNTINDKTKIEVMKRKMMKKSRENHEQEFQFKDSASFNNLIKTVNHVGQFWKDLDEKENRKIISTGPHQDCLIKIIKIAEAYENSTAQ